MSDNENNDMDDDGSVNESVHENDEDFNTAPPPQEEGNVVEMNKEETILKKNNHGGVAPKPKARPKNERTTSKFLTKYEKARVLGTRALQISSGAPITVDISGTGETDPLKIAAQELKKGTLPLIVRRYLPDNTYEDWSLQELR